MRPEQLLLSRILFAPSLFALVLGTGVCACAAAKAAEVPAAQPTAQETSAAEPGTEPAQPKEEGAKGKWIRGSFDAAFDAVWAKGDSDMNLNQSLRIQLDPPEYERIHLRGSLWMLEDLDSDESRTSALRDINDASRSDVRARLLELYADVDNLWGDSTLRIGRQRILEGAAFNRVDGLYFKQRYAQWDWYAFAGARATIYDDAHRDLILGGGACWRPFDRTRVALDVYYGEENRDRGDLVRPWLWTELFGWAFPRPVERELDDTLISLSGWHSLSPNLQLFTRLNWQEGNGDEVLLDATGYAAPWDLTYELSYRRQLNSVGDRVTDLGGFYRVLGAYEKYDDLLVALHKPLSKRVTLSLEAELHDADHENWQTANRDYQRYAAILAAQGLWKGLDASMAVEWWDVDAGESTWAVTGEITKKWTAWELSVGADYERYEDRVTYYNSPLHALDQFRIALLPGGYPGSSPLVLLLDHWVVETHENIHSAYVKAKWAIREEQDVALRVSYEEEDGPQSPYWRLDTGYGIRF